ncbi:DUF1152 domain-containing protein [Nocardia sp. alder85J]|uniref:DUF1152 domain-containing protein n=1 Tax=Nocardia sp. alder85J TaxID=2862949 RepID=UPI001CD4CEF7|nr:DUF1152 domain-containing protein [Nocardia sp. alder85J]MCX4094432.1 DUF1152 domain-containing protein [Nocardia sp. alder85J]
MPKKAIAVAAGGGGDAITTAVLRHRLPDLEVVAIASWSWDRYIVDPTPGPRHARDFRGLRDLGGVFQVPADAALHGPGRSTLPRVAAALDLPVLLIDATGGAVGIAHLFRIAARCFEATELVVVDVGGDILAAGTEPGLRSPLADSLVAAAAAATGLPARLLVTGIGLDGELTVPEVRAALNRFGAVPAFTLTAADVAAYAPMWSWHPSEANGLQAVAAGGWRGTVESQRDALITVTDEQTRVYTVHLPAVVEGTLAAGLTATTSLDDAEAVVRAARGRTDIDIERDRRDRSSTTVPVTDPLTVIDRHAGTATARGADALTIRRVLELCRTAGPAADEMRVQLTTHRSHHLHGPLYLTSGRCPVLG